MKLKESRIGSFIVILAVYVMALALGIDILFSTMFRYTSRAGFVT